MIKNPIGILRASIGLCILSLFLFHAKAKGVEVNIEIQGHRGTRGLYPENTIPSFRSAIQSGADVLEMDLGVTKDGVVVVNHDPYLNPEICLNPDGSKISNRIFINTLTLMELKKYDCGTLKHPRFPRQTPLPGTRIPTLTEVLELGVGNKVRFNIETKVFPDHPEHTVAPDEFAKRVVEVCRKSGFLDRIILQSFDPRTIVAAKKLEPKLRTAILIEDPRLDMIEAARKYQAQIISPEYVLLDAARVSQMHDAGFKVIPWTVNESQDWEKMLAFKVDGIITDYPADLKKFLEKHSARSGSP